MARQYQRWVYPPPILDLENWNADSFDSMDPAHAHRIYWPDREYPSGLDILVAGLGALNTNHSFVACRPARPTAHYNVDFSSADALGYIPMMRPFSGMSANEIAMPHGRVPLNAAHVPFIQLVDGHRTIAGSTEAWSCRFGCLAPA